MNWPKLISKTWNIFEIAAVAGGAYVGEHMGHRLAQQAAASPLDPTALLFSVHEAAFALFWGGLAVLLIKAVDSPLQAALNEWADAADAQQPTKVLTPSPESDKPNP